MSDSAEGPTPQLSLRTFAQDGAMVVQCSGHMVAGMTNALAEEVKPLVSQTGRIILDLAGVIGMDSLGLGTIIGLYVSAKAAGCELKLINLGNRIYELFRIAKVSALFELQQEHPG